MFSAIALLLIFEASIFVDYAYFMIRKIIIRSTKDAFTKILIMVSQNFITDRITIGGQIICAYILFWNGIDIWVRFDIHSEIIDTHFGKVIVPSNP